MPLGDAVKPGYEQPVMIRSGAITSHLTRVEHVHDKGKLAKIVLGLPASREGTAMEALMPASPDSLPPGGQIAGERALRRAGQLHERLPGDEEILPVLPPLRTLLPAGGLVKGQVAAVGEYGGL